MEQKSQSEPQSKPSPLPHAAILHRECLKNHAAGLGRHALDGCRQFLSSPAAAPSDPTSLSCAACGCHRNFHRRVSLAGAPAEAPHHPPSHFTWAPHTLLALSREERPSSTPRKRFRTKFSAEQKGRMMELSERLGWRLRKRDEGLVEDCCREIGVGKGVFKVWMHNNKYQLFRALRRGERERSNVAGVSGAGEVDGNAMNCSSSSS